MASAGAGASSAIRVWALLGARVGDNDQVIALAEALGLPFEVKQLSYNGLNHFGPRLLGGSLASLSASSRLELLSEPPPDLTISTGHRSVPVVRALRHRFARGTRSIHVGFPRVSPGHFELVIATPQYRIPDHPKLLRISYALTRAAVRSPEQDHDDSTEPLSRPRRLLLVGGPTLFWDLDDRLVKATLADMLAEAKKEGGSVVVSTSARTPDALAAEIRRMLEASPSPTLFAQPDTLPRYATLLQVADSIRVTADSVSMLSDAIWTGKPTALVPIAKSPLGKIVFGLADAVGRDVYPQDLRSFWGALTELGVSDALAVPRTSTMDVMQAILDRANAVIDPIVSAESACS